MSVFFLITALAAALMTGCGNQRASSISENYKSADVTAMDSNGFQMNNMEVSDPTNVRSKSETMESSKEGSSELERKLVRTVSLQMETRSFSETISRVKSKTSELGGYIEDITLEGNLSNDSIDPEERTSYDRKYGKLVVRIPSAKADEFLQTAEESGSIIEINENISDITLNYYDSKDRIQTLETEQQRLLELLEQAESVDAIILLEKRLSEIQYELASYKTQIRIYDSQVDYTSITMSISEVVVYTPKGKDPISTQIISGMKQNIEDIKYVVETLLVQILSHLPMLILACIILAIFIFPIRSIYKKNAHRKRNMPMQNPKPDKKMDYN